MSKKKKKSPIREAIIKELKRQKKTVYQVAKEHGSVHPATVKQFLYCGQNTRVRTVERLMEILKLKVVRSR